MPPVFPNGRSDIGIAAVCSHKFSREYADQPHGLRRSASIEIRRARAQWLAGPLIFFIALLVYSPAVGFEWIWDDDQYVTANPLLQSVDGLRRIWFEPTATPQYYPLVFTALWGTMQIFGPEPAAFHLLNILLHAANAWLLYMILGRMQFRAALWIALAFAVHPIHVESVAWVTEIKNVLSGTFYGLAWLVLWPLFRGGRSDDRGFSAKRYAMGGGLFGLALLCKSVTASLPAALLVAVWWQAGRLQRRHWGMAAPLLLIGGLLGWNTARLERSHVGAIGADWDYGLIDRVGIAARSSVHYSANIVAPLEQIFFYPRFGTSFWDEPGNMAAVGLCLAVGLLFGSWAWRGQRGPLAAAAFFVGSALPALGFINVYPHRFSFVADHFVYLPSIGLLCLLMTAVVQAGQWLSRQARFRQIRAGLLVSIPPVFLLSLYTVTTWQHLPAFANEVALWEDTLAKNPNCPAAMQNLALQYLEHDSLQAAQRVLLAADNYDFDRFQTANSLGLVYARMGDTERARQEFERSAQLNPSNADPWINLANLIYSTSDESNREDALARATEFYRRAWEIAPEERSAFGLATLYHVKGQAESAMDWYRQVLQLNERNQDARFNLATLLLESGQVEVAWSHCQQLVIQFPSDADTQRLARQLESLRAK